MIYRQLGKTDLNLSVIGIGTHQFGGEWGIHFSDRDVNAILSRGKELGINFIDTAASYGHHLSESLIGQAVAKNRSDWIIATKFGNKYNADTGETLPDFSLDQIRQQLDASLKALKTDYIDLYQFHSGTNKDFDNNKLWDFLQQQVQAGKIRYLGLSIAHDLVHTDDLHQVKHAKDYGIASLQIVYNRLVTKAEERVLPVCQKEGLGVLARVPLARGFLSGKYQKGHTFSQSDYRNRFGDTLNNDLLQQAKHIQTHEVPTDTNMAQWALSWCLKNPAITGVIPGCKNVAQIESNAMASRLVTS